MSKENHSPIIKSSKNSTTSLPFQSYISKKDDNLKSSSKVNKFEILFSNTKRDYESSSDQKTNFNSKSSKNILFDSYFKISEFSSKNVNSNYKEKSLENLQSFPKSSGRPKMILSEHNKKAAIAPYLYQIQDGKNYDSLEKNSNILDYNKKHTMSLIFKKKSKTKFNKIKSNIVNVNKYALLNNFENEFRRSFLRENKEIHVDSSNTIYPKLKTSHENRQHSSFIDENEHINDYNKIRDNHISNRVKVKKLLNNLRESQDNFRNSNSDLYTQTIPLIKTPNISDKIINDPSYNGSHINDILEQNKKILVKEEYYRKVEELTKSQIFDLNKNKRISIRKSALNFLINVDSINNDKEIKSEIGNNPDIKEFALFNIKKKFRKSSLNIQNNFINNTPLDFNFRTDGAKQTKDGLALNRRSTSVQLIRESKFDKPYRPRFKSNLINNPVNFANTLGIIANKKELDIKNNQNLWVVKIDNEMLPGSKLKNPIHQREKSIFLNENNNDNKLSMRPSHLKLNNIPFRKFSNKLLQTDNALIKFREDQDKLENNMSNPSNIANPDGLIAVSLFYNKRSKSGEMQVNPIIEPEKNIINIKKNSFINTNNQTPLKSARGSSLVTPSATPNKIKLNICNDANHNKIDFTHYEKDLIKKIKLIKKFVNKQKSEAFKSEKRNYKKIYVVQDGITILKDLNFTGKFVNIPTIKYLTQHGTQTERNEKLLEFLKEASKEFNVDPGYTHIFTINGRRVYDLREIPEEDNCCYVCN